MALVDKLHDEIDTNEDLREIALAVVEEVKGEIRQIAAAADSFDEVLEEVALRIEARLAEVTTDAARKGIAAGKARVGK